jgi:hypothetical protein
VVDVEDIVTTTRTLFGKVVSDFDVAEVGFIGVRTYWAAASDDFDELRDWLRDASFASSLQEALHPVGQVTDIGWVCEFMHEDPKHRLAVGPMTREQLQNQILRSAREDDFSEVFLWMDFDRVYNETAHAQAEVVERWERSFRRNLELAAQVGEQLTGSRPFT